MNTNIKYSIAILIISIISLNAFSKKRNKKETIHWMTINEVEQKMKTDPKPVYVDIYTNWCGWCKVMDKKTFTNKKVIEYINKNFYAIHFNAEQIEPITFKGIRYITPMDTKTSNLALEWMQGSPSYPTSVFLDETFSNPKPVPGYLDVKDMEMMAKYFGENIYKTIAFDIYKNGFKSSW